jgi:hypothetical protein
VRRVIFCSFFDFAEIITFPSASIIHSLSSIFAPRIHTSGRTGSDQPGDRCQHKPYDAICNCGGSDDPQSPRTRDPCRTYHRKRARPAEAYR